MNQEGLIRIANAAFDLGTHLILSRAAAMITVRLQLDSTLCSDWSPFSGSPTSIGLI
jgi:hypothetical protein